MLCCAKWLKALCCVVLLSCNVAILAQSTTSVGLQGKSLLLVPNVVRGAWDLQAEFNIKLPSSLADLAKSVPLYFVLDWRINRPRWYWRDEKLARGQLYWRLSHNALTQQWRMSSANTEAITDGRFALTFSSLDEALGSLRRIRRDGLVHSANVQANQTYEISARLRLDTNLLPKPFQINALTNNDWALDSGLMQSVVVATPPLLSK